MKTHKTVPTGISEVSTDNHRVVSRDEWVAERRALLAHEKELTRLRDQIARERRALPWVRIDKNYVFDAPEGPAHTRRIVRRSPPTAGATLHVGPGGGSKVVRAAPSWLTTATA